MESKTCKQKFFRISPKSPPISAEKQPYNGTISRFGRSGEIDNDTKKCAGVHFSLDIVAEPCYDAIMVSVAQSKREPKEKRYTMGTTPQTAIEKVTPSSTGTFEFPVTVKKAGKKVTKTAKVKLYSTSEDLLVQEFKGNMEELLEQWNAGAIAKGKAAARQAAYMVLLGPAKKIYAMAGKMVRDSKSFSEDGSPTISAETAFGIAKDAYSKGGIFTTAELNAVEFDASKINVGEEEEETEESE